MSKVNLSEYGIDHSTAIYYNLSYSELLEREKATKDKKCFKVSFSKDNVASVHTDKKNILKIKYIVKSKYTTKNVWWNDKGSSNIPMEKKTWDFIYENVEQDLDFREIYVMDGFAGNDPKHKIPIRFITDVVWLAHFFRNMFDEPTKDELTKFKPSWSIIYSPQTEIDKQQNKLCTDKSLVAINIKARRSVITGTWQTSEITNTMFSVLNYFYPLSHINIFRCAASYSDNDLALFFGSTGSDKHTLSSLNDRTMIGDNFNTTSPSGVYNVSNGYYLQNFFDDKHSRFLPAIKTDALLENINVDAKHNAVEAQHIKPHRRQGVSIPIENTKNTVMGTPRQANTIVFITCDAYGVLPPVAKLSKGQAVYHFLSGYTSVLEELDNGDVTVKPVFSTCYNKSLLTLSPLRYAKQLKSYMKENKAQAYLLNTGWFGGNSFNGERISIAEVHAILNLIFSGEISNFKFKRNRFFNFRVPISLDTKISDLNKKIMNPANAWEDKKEYHRTYKILAKEFNRNFLRFKVYDPKVWEKYVRFGPIV